MSEAVTRIQNDQKSVLLERLIDANPTVFTDLKNVLRIVKDASFYTANDAFDGIVVSRKLCNKAEFTEWDLAKYKHLKGVCVLDYSLENIQSLSLSPCAELEKLIICSHCFENGTGSFVVDACHCLKSVEIGSFSFQKFSSFFLRDSSLQTVTIGDNSFSSCSAVVFEGFSFARSSLLALPNLSSLKMGRNVFQCSAVKSSLVMESLLVVLSSPLGLEGLKSLTGSYGCFSGVETLKLKDIPNLEELSLPNPFQKLKKKPVLVNVSLFETLSQFQPFLRTPGEVKSDEDFHTLSLTVPSIQVVQCDLKQEHLSFLPFSELESLTIENGCFPYPSIVEIYSLKKLKRVVIGDDCFTTEEQNASLVVKDCEQLNLIKIGRRCFSSFGKLSLANVPALEQLVIGSNCFTKADLTLVALPSLKSVTLGEKSFELFRHAVISGVDEGSD